MSHRRRRISRVLLAVLAVTIAVGVFSYVRRGSTQANEVAAAGTDAGTSTATQEATHPAAQPQSTQPQSQQTLASLPQVTGGAVIEPLKHALPQQPITPLVTQTPDAATNPTLPAVSSPTTAIPVAAPGHTGAGAAKSTPPAIDPSKVSIKSNQPSVATAPPSAAGVVAEGRAKVQAGKYLEARDAVNAALVSGRLRGTDADAARTLLSDINQTIVFSNRKFADDRYGGTYQVQSGDRLDKIGARHNITADMLKEINGLSDPRRLRAGAWIKVLKGPFHAVVSKSAFRLDLYLGGLPGSGSDVVYVTSFPVGLGKDDSTPLGKWQVEPDRKVKNPVYYSPRGEGVIEADDPKNPLGEFWIGLVGVDGDAVGKESYGIHGTIEPDSIGKMESMGCIRLRNEDIAVVFSALVEGKSTVQIVP